MNPHACCGYCGSDFAGPWPRKCDTCGNTTWANPTPVAVLLVPVIMDTRWLTGVLTVRRGIEPAKGKLALPGGFIELGETWQEAAVRELREETGITTDPSRLRIFDVYSAEKTILVFARTPPISRAALVNGFTNHEVIEVVVVEQPVTDELAWSSHTEMARRLFEES